jgi:PBSX family phage terminase large subunit
MDDNPFITVDYKDYLKRQYKGLWYQRYIEGKWVQAEGSVYGFFDEKTHVIDHTGFSATYYILGVDYGTINPCAFILIGYNPYRLPNIWVEDEYYYSSRVSQRQKTDGEYADDLQRFIEGKRIEGIYIDPSAASFRVELAKRGVEPLLDANNDVNAGIGFVGMKLNEGSFKIRRQCKNLIAEFQSYVWDEKAAKLGVERPKKENDHALDALRYALLTHFFGQEGEPLTPQDLEKRWREAMNYGPNLPPQFQNPVDRRVF